MIILSAALILGGVYALLIGHLQGIGCILLGLTWGIGAYYKSKRFKNEGTCIKP